MSRISTILFTIIGIAGFLFAGGVHAKVLKDLYFGDALYYAYQAEYFDAISRLDTELGQYYGLDEPELNSLYQHIDSAEFSVGDFELYYRMHNRAGRAIKAVIEGNVEEIVRNEALYRLAKIFYQKQQHNNALHTIDRIRGKLPEKLRLEEPFLRAQIYIATGNLHDAIDLLKTIENAKEMLGFAGFNLGVALFHSGDEEAGIKQLDKVGKLESKDEKALAMRDKANLVLGFRLLEAQKHQQAKFYLDRVRLKGPFSNKALLGSGWAAAAAGKYARALVPWTLLSKRNVTNKAVQEVLLGVPYAYAKLELYGKSALLYGKALELYSTEIDRLDASIASIRKGNFLDAVVREELKQDKHWLINLRNLPDTPETHYLMQMMASHDFQESLKNYFDLAELKRKLELWVGYLAAWEDIIAKRAAYYEPLLPEIETQFRKLDSKMKLRVEQRNALDKRLKKMLISPRPDFLTSVDERILLQQIKQLEFTLKKQSETNASVKQRIARLRGVIKWKINLQYQDRFSSADKHLRELDEDVERLDVIYKSFVRTRQVATQSYKGYEKKINHLRIKIRQATEKVKMLMARQGDMINSMATQELEKRRQRLEKYQVKARFAMAESYDRATKKQTEQVLEKNKPPADPVSLQQQETKPEQNSAQVPDKKQADSEEKQLPAQRNDKPADPEK